MRRPLVVLDALACMLSQAYGDATTELQAGSSEAKEALATAERQCGKDPSLPVCPMLGPLGAAVILSDFVVHSYNLQSSASGDLFVEYLQGMQDDLIQIAVELKSWGSIITKDGHCDDDGGSCRQLLTSCQEIYNNGKDYFGQADLALQNIECDNCVNVLTYNIRAKDTDFDCPSSTGRRLREIAGQLDGQVQTSAAGQLPWLPGLAITTMGCSLTNQDAAVVAVAGLALSLTGCEAPIDTYYANCNWIGQNCDCGAIDRSRCNCLARAKKGMDLALSDLSRLNGCLCAAGTPNFCPDHDIVNMSASLKLNLVKTHDSFERVVNMTRDQDENKVLDCDLNFLDLDKLAKLLEVEEFASVLDRQSAAADVGFATLLAGQAGQSTDADVLFDATWGTTGFVASFDEKISAARGTSDLGDFKVYCLSLIGVDCYLAALHGGFLFVLLYQLGSTRTLDNLKKKDEELKKKDEELKKKHEELKQTEKELTKTQEELAELQAKLAKPQRLAMLSSTAAGTALSQLGSTSTRTLELKKDEELKKTVKELTELQVADDSQPNQRNEASTTEPAKPTTKPTAALTDPLLDNPPHSQKHGVANGCWQKFRDRVHANKDKALVSFLKTVDQLHRWRFFPILLALLYWSLLSTTFVTPNEPMFRVMQILVNKLGKLKSDAQLGNTDPSNQQLINNFMMTLQSMLNMILQDCCTAGGLQV